MPVCSPPRVTHAVMFFEPSRRMGASEVDLVVHYEPGLTGQEGIQGRVRRGEGHPRVAHFDHRLALPNALFQLATRLSSTDRPRRK